ncbi:MAG TPA: phytanoyl-CoA dioxygenase family protein [Rhizomicrobium sp.]|nr:phytanoyl-CoA dioxygenase family protein [Rhizomicrobium sp.]
MDLAAAGKTFRDDGVALLPGALDAAALADALAAYDWSLAHPGPAASKIRQHGDALFYQDLYNPGCVAAYRSMLEASPLPKLIADIWETPDVWFMYEQVFLKDGGESRRTPWHQDLSYLTVAGDDLAVAWITFDAVSKTESLEFVRGSHKGVLYNGSSFALDDDTAPLHAGDALPRLPDIEAERNAHDIVSFAVAPGDVVLFHPKMLHGGAPTHPGMRRRTLTLRFFGRDCFYDARPGRAGPRRTGSAMRQGDPFRDPAFLKLR